MTNTTYQTAADGSYGLRIVATEGSIHTDDYGICRASRKSGGKFSANIGGGEGETFKSLKTAIAYLAKHGYDAFGNAV